MIDNYTERQQIYDEQETGKSVAAQIWDRALSTYVPNASLQGHFRVWQLSKKKGYRQIIRESKSQQCISLVS